MKIQIALDLTSLEDARAIMKDVYGYIDIVEIGMLFSYVGYEGYHVLKQEFPNVEYLIDQKVTDGGYFCTLEAAKHGAQYITVVGATDIETVASAMKASKETGVKVVIDMLGVENLYEKTKQLDDLGVHYINIHTPADLQAQGKTPFENLRLLNSIIKNSKVAVAGGINTENIINILPYHPDIVIIGGALIKSENRREYAKKLKKIIEEYKG